MHIMGHRGAAGIAPENTLESIQKALDVGVDWVEFDVRATADGRLVVIHDPKTKRIAEESVKVHKASTSHLQRLPTKSRSIIPTLPEVVQLIGDRARINIEIKSPNCAPEVVASIKKLVNAGYEYNHFLVSSYRIKLLLEIQALDPKIPLSLLAYSVPMRFMAARQLGLKLKAVGFNQHFITPQFVKLAKSKRLYVYAFTINDQKTLDKLERWGLDAVVTDHPEKFILGHHRTPAL